MLVCSCAWSCWSLRSLAAQRAPAVLHVLQLVCWELYFVCGNLFLVLPLHCTHMLVGACRSIQTCVGALHLLPGRQQAPSGPHQQHSTKLHTGTISWWCFLALSPGPCISYSLACALLLRTAAKECSQ